MASLTEISIGARKTIRYAVYLLIIGLIARTAISVGKGIYLRLFPPPPPEATVAFGKLPRLPFPERKFPNNPNFPDKLNYKMETADNKFPVFPIQLPVYLMPPIPQNINALSDAKQKAEDLGFDPNGRPVLESTPNVYLFQKRGTPSTLTMNIITGVFSMSYDVGQDPSILTGVPLDPDKSGEQATSFLNSAKLLDKDLEKGKITHQFFKAAGKDIVPADSLSDANLIKINIFRKNYGANGEIGSVTPKMPEANVWFMMGEGARQIVTAEYHFYPIDSSKSGTYPLLKSEEAWDNLKNKKGFISNLGTNPDGNITVRKIYLAYYDAGLYQQYYQPVVVFEGDNDFIAFVPAVKENYYGADPEASQNK